MWIKVSPINGVMRFGKKGKVAPKYNGPFPIVARVGNVAYKLELHPELGHIPDTFHVNMLKRYLSNPKQAIPASDISVTLNLFYEEELMKVLAKDVRKLRSKWINMVKI